MDVNDVNLIPATFTPMKEDGSVNPDAIPQYAEFLGSRGIKTVFVNGSTGECMSLTVGERKTLLEAWVKQREADKSGITTVLAHVGAENLGDCKELARHAASVKADAISLVSPTYFKPRNVDDLIEFCTEVAAQAPELPFYYYHLPGLTGVDFDMVAFLERGAKKIPTLKGLKFSSFKLTEASQCFDLEDRKFHIMYGCDEQSLGARAMGIKSYVGSTYNFIPRVYQDMHEAYSRPDTEAARQHMLRAQKAVNVYFEYMGRYFVGALKCLMELAGVPLGPPRLPLIPVSAQDKEAMRTKLQAAGFFDLI